MIRLQVAEAALCVLHALLTRIRVRADTKRMLCHAVLAADVHQPLVSLMHIHPKPNGSSSKVSFLPCLVHGGATCYFAPCMLPQQSGCASDILSCRLWNVWQRSQRQVRPACVCLQKMGVWVPSCLSSARLTRPPSLCDQLPCCCSTLLNTSPPSGDHAGTRTI